MQGNVFNKVQEIQHTNSRVQMQPTLHFLDRSDRIYFKHEKDICSLNDYNECISGLNVLYKLNIVLLGGKRSSKLQ